MSRSQQALLNTLFLLACSLLFSIVVNVQNDPYRPSSGVCNAPIDSLIATYELRCSSAVKKQFMHETQNFTSDIFLECHNPSGMKEASRKIQARGCRGHAGYHTLCDAFLDYKRYQDIYLPAYEKRTGIVVDTDDEYFDFLVAQDYAEDPNYKENIKTNTEKWILQ